jgi:hypothetical protein
MHKIPSALLASQRAKRLYVAGSTHVRLVVLLALEALEAVSLKHDLGGLWADKEPVDGLGVSAGLGRGAEKQKSRKAEKQKSRKAEKQASEQGGESWSQSVLVQDEAV